MDKPFLQHSIKNFLFYLVWFQVQVQLLDRSTRTVKVGKLEPDTRYLVCVVGLSTWMGNHDDDFYRWNSNSTSLSLHLVDSPTSKCTEARTLDAPEMSFGKGNLIKIFKHNAYT